MDDFNYNEIRWKVVTYPGVRPNMYAISEDGDLMNMLAGYIHTKSYDKDGYVKYSLQSNDPHVRGKSIFAHRLVAYEFVPNPNNYPVIDHLDGVKNHNHYTNLEWVTVKENTNRAERMGLRKVRGEDNPTAKYTEKEIRRICEMFEEGFTLKEVYRHMMGDPFASYNDNRALYKFLYALKTKTAWPDVVCDYAYSPIQERESWKDPTPQTSNYVYSEETIREICVMLENKCNMLDIVEHFTGTRDSHSAMYDLINSIRSKKRWVHISDEYNIDPSACKERVPYTADPSYEQLSVEIANYIDEGYRNKEIYNVYGVNQRNNNRKYKMIKRIIDNYKTAKELPKDAIIVA